jgi:anti-sigma factor RsiW
MARCEDMKFLLGPFEDGELEPHEMQEVARHLVGCADCDGELADYRTLAVSLRSTIAIPDLTGFRASVMARVDELPIPLRLRLRRYMTSFTDGIGATLATGFATAAVAVATAVVLTPYLKQSQFMPLFGHPVQVAHAAPGKHASAPISNIARNKLPSVIPPDVARDLSNGTTGEGGDIAPVMQTQDPSAIIDRLEANNPSVAVWSEPQSNTTVIWVPDQQR